MIVDIEHRPNTKGSLGGPEVPVLLTHGHIMSLPRSVAGEEQRWTLATGLEHFAFQGFSLQESFHFGVSRRKDIIAGMSEKDQKMLAGNGMHLVTQTSWMYYILGHVSKLDEESNEEVGRSSSWDEVEQQSSQAPNDASAAAGHEGQPTTGSKSSVDKDGEDEEGGLSGAAAAPER